MGGGSETSRAGTRRSVKPKGGRLLAASGSWLCHPIPQDRRRWTAEGLQREVESRGFRMVRIEPVVGPLALTTIYRTLGLTQFLKRIPFLAGAVAVPLNVCAWLEDRITPRSITAVNACTYIAFFRRA